MTVLADWLKVHRQMIAKSLRELCYEQVFRPQCISKETQDHGALKLQTYDLKLKSGVTYQFRAWQGIWTDLKVQTEGLLRNGEEPVSAAQFFIDSQYETGMTDIVLANFLEELHNSLYADVTLLNKTKEVSASEMVLWSGEKIQTLLNGHPKILISKGRLGWSAADQDSFGPEQEKPLQFAWLALKKQNAISGMAPEWTQEKLLQQSFQATDLKKFKDVLLEKNLDLENWMLCPVHPWQWERYIKIQFAAAIAQGQIHFLGVAGDFYLPQISLRTFSNISRPQQMDIKLPLTILNTSSIRGIPARYIATGAALSEDLKQICLNDPFLRQAKTEVLTEKAGVAFLHSEYSQVSAAPYRYHELLGAIWRSSSQSLLAPDEKAVIAGSFFHHDKHNKSLIGAYIQDSGLSCTDWLKAYFKVVVLPLYHLQVKYGIGLVAHGQNIVVRLKGSRPVGLFLKDFQGDLRISEGSNSLQQDLTRLPSAYLIHDLITGHFVTVLRFISETLQECDQYPELDFYQVLASVLREYQGDFPEITAHPDWASLNLLQARFARVVVNRVRFKIGYADSAERPLPILGDDLENPLALAQIEVSL